MSSRHSRSAILLGLLSWLCTPPSLICLAEDSSADFVRKTLLQWSGSVEEGGPPGFEEALASDRPDFTEASVTVGRGVRQLEMGYTLFRDDSLAATEQSYPEFLFRYGLFAEWFEFRIGWNFGVVSQGTGASRTTLSGSEDLYLGIKLGLTGQAGVLPEMALVPQMTVPTGHRELTAGEVLPGLNWLYGWDLNDFLSLGGSTQGNLEVDDADGENFFEFAQSLTIGYTLTEKWGAYTEWFVLAPAGATTARTEHYLDGGFICRITNNLQLDVRAGKGLSASAFDYFVGSGAVVRW